MFEDRKVRYLTYLLVFSIFINIISVYKIRLLNGLVDTYRKNEKTIQIYHMQKIRNVKENYIRKIELLEDICNDLNMKVESYVSLENRHREDIVTYIVDNYKRPQKLAEQFADVILEKSEEYGIPYIIVMGITEVESSFNPKAISNKHARGPMQVRYSVWGDYLGLEKPEDLHKVDVGIDSGVRVLKYYLSKTKNDIRAALYKYVGGDVSYARSVYDKMSKFILYQAERSA